MTTIDSIAWPENENSCTCQGMDFYSPARLPSALERGCSLKATRAAGRAQLFRLVRSTSAAALFLLLRLLLLALLSPPFAASQDAAPRQISGVVNDQNGAALVAAEVVFRSGSFVSRQLTDDRGEFAFSQVVAASGMVTVSAPVIFCDRCRSQPRELDPHPDLSVFWASHADLELAD
jgi:hypothetical protein